MWGAQWVLDLDCPIAPWRRYTAAIFRYFPRSKKSPRCIYQYQIARLIHICCTQEWAPGYWHYPRPLTMWEHSTIINKWNSLATDWIPRWSRRRACELAACTTHLQSSRSTRIIQRRWPQRPGEQDSLPLPSFSAPGIESHPKLCLASFIISYWQTTSKIWGYKFCWYVESHRLKLSCNRERVPPNEVQTNPPTNHGI